MESWLGGMQSMLIAIVILVLAWGLGGITHELGTGTYLASLLADTLPLPLLPGVVFLIASMIAFSTGTSWGTLAVLFALVFPIQLSFGVRRRYDDGAH